LDVRVFLDARRGRPHALFRRVRRHGKGTSATGINPGSQQPGTHTGSHTGTQTAHKDQEIATNKGVETRERLFHLMAAFAEEHHEEREIETEERADPTAHQMRYQPP